MSALSLRPYQQDAVGAVARSFFGAGGYSTWRQLLVCPTGGGKTVIFASILQHAKIQEWMEKYGAARQKALVLAHREELLEQAANKILWANPGLRVDIEQANRRSTPFSDVVVASVQTLSNDRRLTKLNPDDFRIVIIDECHHATAPSYQKILQHFGFLPPDDFMKLEAKPRNAQEGLRWQRHRLEQWDEFNRPERLLVGVTATPKRGDNIGLEAVFQDVVHSTTILQMIRWGYLSRPRAFKVETSTDLDAVHRRAGDFAMDELSDAVDNEERNVLAVKSWGEYAYGRKTIAFCVDVKHAHSLADTFRRHGIRSESIHGGLPSDERKRILKDFSSGKITVLTNCNILTEGFDEPSVSCVLHCRPTQSSLLYIQMTGRGLRLADGKDDCIVIDLVDITSRHQLVTAPELVGLPAKFNLEGQDLEEVVTKIEKLKKENPYLDIAKGKTVNDLEMMAREIDLFATMDTSEIDGFAKMNWMKYSDDSYQISFPGIVENELIHLNRNTLGKWEMNHSGKGFAKPLASGQAQEELRDAIEFAEAWIKNNRPEAIRVTDKKSVQRWGKDAATEPQLKLLRRLASKAGVPMPLETELTKGQASNMINRLIEMEASKKRSKVS
jgi:ATP-dependent helicase IRC3